MNFKLNKKVFYTVLFLIGGFMVFSLFKVTDDLVAFANASIGYCVNFISSVQNIGITKLLSNGGLALILLFSFFKAIKFFIIEILNTRKLRKWFVLRSINSDNGIFLIRDESIYALTIGFIKPIIVYTSGLKKVCTKSELDAILLHEESHKINRDPLKRLFYGMMNSFFFFIPSIKQITSSLIIEHEKNADNKVRLSGLKIQLDNAMKKVLCKKGILSSSNCYFNSFVERMENGKGISINIPISSIIISIVSVLGIFALTSYTHAENHIGKTLTTNTSSVTVSCSDTIQSYNFTSLKNELKWK